MANIRVMVTGAAGKMGREVVKAVAGAQDVDLAAAVDPHFAASRGTEHGAADIGEVAGIGTLGVPVDRNLAASLERTKPDVVVDFTRPDAVMGNLREILGAGVSAVVGTTGFSEADLEELRRLCAESGAACFIAPNFAIGAVLMMQFATAAARFMPDVEIIEMHHNQKLDAPSGTAMKTAQMIAAARQGASVDKTEKVTLEGARGGDLEGIKVHSVRLPGFVASQAVIFGGQGQTLTIRHDTLDRTSFMPGVLLAVRKVGATSGVTVGLETFLSE
jgi:4-hydroxy-tetrahydrodipicolinate reductase